MTRTRRARWATAVVAATLVLGACGGASPKPAAPTVTPAAAAQMSERSARFETAVVPVDAANHQFYFVDLGKAVHSDAMLAVAVDRYATAVGVMRTQLATQEWGGSQGEVGGVTNAADAFLDVAQTVNTPGFTAAFNYADARLWTAVGIVRSNLETPAS